ncbi:MAG: 3'-5' exonuclease [Desulfomonilaceae bacterium]
MLLESGLKCRDKRKGIIREVTLRFPFMGRRAVDRHPLLLQNDKVFKKFEMNRPLPSYDFVAFDTELTGLNPAVDEIVSIAGIRIRNLHILVEDSFYSYAKPKIEEHTLGTFVHRITPDELRKAPSLTEVLESFLNFCADSVLIGHHVYIDMAFLGNAMKRTLGGMMRNPVMDCLQLAMCYRNNHKVAPGYQDIMDARSDPYYNLSTLCKSYCLPAFPQHDALQDALQTAYLFIFLVTKMGGPDLETFEELYRLGCLPSSCW